VSHYAYAPVGYYLGEYEYCLDCIPKMAAIPGKGNGGNGYKRGACNCAECRLDRMAAARGIDRMNERSYSMSTFPQHISYHNDIHADCEQDEFSDDGRWLCYSRCAECHEVIDGVSTLSGPDTCPAMPEPSDDDN
jgi:hypothetical protein